MANLGLKRAARTTVKTSAGEFTIRPLSAMDISDLVQKFDLETVELTARIINHIQAGKTISEFFADPRSLMGLFQSVPALAASALTLVAGGDDEDHDAIRELPAEDFAMAVTQMVAFSLERIGGLGKLLDLLTEAASKMSAAFENEVRKRSETISS